LVTSPGAIKSSAQRTWNGNLDASSAAIQDVVVVLLNRVSSAMAVMAASAARLLIHVKGFRAWFPLAGKPQEQACDPISEQLAMSGSVHRV